MDPTKLKLIKETSRREILFSIAHVPGTSRVLAGSSDGKIYDFDALADKPDVKELSGHESYVTGLAIAANVLVSGSYDRQLIWWNLETREQLRKIPAHSKWIRKVAIAPDGKTLASVADDMVVRVWNVESGERVHELKGHAVTTPSNFPSMLYSCVFSADGTKLASVDRLGKGIVWDVATGSKLAEVVAPILYTWDPKQRIHSIGGARSVAFSPDGKLLAIGGMGQVGNIDHLEGVSHVDVFAWEKQERTHELVGDGMKGLAEQLLFSPDGKLLLALGGDNSGWLQWFDLETKKTVRQEKSGQHWHAAQYEPESTRLFAAGHGKIAVWEMKG